MLEIVVAYYNNSYYKNTIELFPDAQVVVYDKSEQHNCDLAGERLSSDDFSKIITVHRVENIGREGETYLRHIIENYNNLNEYTMFIQDDTDNHIPDPSFFCKITRDAINDNKLFHHYATSWKVGWGTYSRTICNGHCTLETFPYPMVIQDVCQKFGIFSPYEYTTETCAFLLVHKDKIRQRPKEFYIKIKEWLLEADSHGYVLEHLWHLIFL
jgi:hypothetical protein